MCLCNCPRKSYLSPPMLTKAVFGLSLPPTCPNASLWPIWKYKPVSVWKQCSLNVSVSNISMPELPCSGDSWEPIANSLFTKEAKLGMHPTALKEECLLNFSTEVMLSAEFTLQRKSVRRGSVNCLAAVSKFLSNSLEFCMDFIAGPRITSFY